MKKIWDGIKGSRKFQGWIALLLGITAMAIYKDATFVEWFDAQKWAFGLYVSGNGLEHGARAYQDKGASTDTESR